MRLVEERVCGREAMARKEATGTETGRETAGHVGHVSNQDTVQHRLRKDGNKNVCAVGEGENVKSVKKQLTMRKNASVVLFGRA